MSSSLAATALLPSITQAEATGAQANQVALTLLCLLANAVVTLALVVMAAMKKISCWRQPLFELIAFALLANVANFIGATMLVVIALPIPFFLKLRKRQPGKEAADP